MKTEYEAKYLQVDIADIRRRLTEAGGTLQTPMRLMRRVIIETPALKAKNGYMRIRDEGDRVTVTYKQFDALSIDGAKEQEIIVDDFDAAIALFESLDLPHSSYQESKRETWRLGDAEIVIDEWPWLDPYIEIEAADEAAVQAAAEQLGLKWSEAEFGDIMVAYRRQYPHLGPKDTVGNLPQVRFEDPLPAAFAPKPSHA